MEGKGKIQIKPRGAGRNDALRSSGGFAKDLDEVKNDIKKLKKQVGRLLNIAEHEENIMAEYQDKAITLKLVDGSEESGNLKTITKFQIVIVQDGKDTHYYKSAVIKYHF